MLSHKFSLILLTIFQLVETRKPHTLQLFELLPITGNLPRNGADCRSTSQIVVDVVNNKSDILPDYHIELITDDEFTDGQGSVTKAVTFWRQSESNASVNLAPVMVAGYFSSGCIGLGPILHHINMVAFSISCSSQLLTDRVKNPNLYLNRAISQSIVFGQVQFIKKIGGWKKIAVLGYLGNDNNYASAKFLTSIAPANNLSVIWFDSYMDFTTLVSLKESGARIVVFWCSQLNLAWQFFCTTYQLGMTGSRYLFIVQGQMLADSDSVPKLVYPGCTREIIVEQYKITIGTGQNQVPNVKTDVSYFGYDANAFDTMFDKYTNSSRSVDYPYRFQCHDATASAIITLHEAEKALTTTYSNITLKDYRQHPDIVMKAVNDSAIKLDYAALRTGRIKYGSTGELSTDFVSITYLSGGKKLLYLGTLRQKDNTGGHQTEDYLLNMMSDIPWTTLDGKPPRDAATTTLVFVTVPIGVTTAVTVIVAISVTFDVFGIVKTATNRHSTEKLTKIIGGLACVLLNVSTILFAIDAELAPFLGSIRIFVAAFGLSVINGILFARMYCSFKKIPRTVPRYRASNNRNHTESNTVVKRQTIQQQNQAGNILLTVEQPYGHFNRNDDIITPPKLSAEPAITSYSVNSRDTLPIICGFTIANTCIVAGWLLSDPVYCRENAAKPFYDFENDSYTELRTTVCSSQNPLPWLFSLIAEHVLLMVAAGVYTYEIRSRDCQNMINEFIFKAIGVVNSVVVMIAATLLLLVIRNPTSQDIAVSFVTAILTAGASSTFFIPVAFPSHQDETLSSHTNTVKF